MLGSVVAVTDEDGNKICEGDYTPFGERIRKDSGNGFDLGGLFNGKEFDEDTGLYHFNARCMTRSWGDLYRKILLNVFGPYAF